MQSFLESTVKTYLREKTAARDHVLSTAAAIITYAKAYDLSTMSIHSVVRYFLLLNQLKAGDIFISYSYCCWAGL